MNTPRVKVVKLDRRRKKSIDLRGLPSNRYWIRGTVRWLTESERAEYGGTTYELVREPKSRHHMNAVAIYGKGRKVGYMPAVKAAAFAPLLDALAADSYIVSGTSMVDGSIRLWVDLPSVPQLRRFVEERR